MSSREAGVFFFPVQALSPSLVRLRRKKQPEMHYRCTVPNLRCSPFNLSLIDKVSENGGYIVVTVGHSPSTLEMFPGTIKRGGEVMWLSLWFRLLQKYRKGGKWGVFCISSLPPCWSFMLWPNELAVWKILLWQSIFGKRGKMRRAVRSNKYSLGSLVSGDKCWLWCTFWDNLPPSIRSNPAVLYIQRR